MQEFLIYISGWILFIICYYIYNVYVINNEKYSKKQLIYHGFKYGIFSWVGLFICLIIFIVAELCYWIMCIDEYIENKLK